MKNLKVLFRYLKTFSRSNQYDILSKYTFKGCFFMCSLFPKLYFIFYISCFVFCLICITSFIVCIYPMFLNLPMSLYRYKSSHPEMFLRRSALKICCKFTGEHPCQSVISIKLKSSFIKIALGMGVLL